MTHVNQPLQSFLDQLAAKQPTPGGGSASALGGAIGAALGSMAANYTLGNEKYPAFQSAAHSVNAKLTELRASLLRMMDADIAAYESYRAAVSMPKQTPEEKSARGKALAAAREAATAVPERILSAALNAMIQIQELSAAVNPNLAGDVASAAYFLEACARGAAIQIFANCTTDDPTGANLTRRNAAADAVAQCQQLRESIHATVLKLLKPEA